ncbi:MAG: type III PLP-dependent enzyme [candidate division Zixibacteria bacterium]
MTHSFDINEIVKRQLMPQAGTEVVRELFELGNCEVPQLLLSRSEIGRNIRALRNALPRAEIYYAVKSNNHPVIIDEVAQAGGNFDICSAGEIERIASHWHPPQDLLHTHPIKSIDEFDSAVAAGVRTFVVDNQSEVEKLWRYKDCKLKILVRFRIPTNSRAVVNLQYKFGCTTEEVMQLAKLIEQSGHEFQGLSFHIGSQCSHSENYLLAIKAASTLIRKLDLAGLPLSVLDIGGGFPVEYIQPMPSIDKFCAPINIALQEHIRPGIKVICEPGRFISASAATLVCSVIGKAVRDGKIWYYLDDGLYSTFSGILYDQCQYPVLTDRRGPARLSVLAGPTCDSFDVMYDGLMIPEHQIGDIIAFPRTGAYCAVSGSDFNSLKRPEYRIID